MMYRRLPVSKDDLCPCATDPGAACVFHNELSWVEGGADVPRWVVPASVLALAGLLVLVAVALGWRP
jgi:hypothetical protein